MHRPRERSRAPPMMGVTMVIDTQTVVQDAEQQRNHLVCTRRLPRERQPEGGDGLPVLRTVYPRVGVRGETGDRPNEQVWVRDVPAEGRASIVRGGRHQIILCAERRQRPAYAR